jgi:cytochrome c oxidase cbb3-type subunit 3
MSKKPEEQPEIRSHVYDGIEEYDQKLPNWWLFTLYIAIAFFVVHWLIHFQFRVVPTDAQRLDPVVANIRDTRMKAMLAMLNDDTLAKMTADQAVVADGQKIYQQICLACHGPNLGGRTEAPLYIGASLADAQWRYGGKPTDIYKMISEGSPSPLELQAKGEIPMPAQGQILSPEKVAAVAAFVLSHHPSPAAP